MTGEQREVLEIATDRLVQARREIVDAGTWADQDKALMALIRAGAHVEQAAKEIGQVVAGWRS